MMPDRWDYRGYKTNSTSFIETIDCSSSLQAIQPHHAVEFYSIYQLVFNDNTVIHITLHLSIHVFLILKCQMEIPIQTST